MDNVKNTSHYTLCNTCDKCKHAGTVDITRSLLYCRWWKKWVGAYDIACPKFYEGGEE